MKITKKAFIEAMVANLTYFCGTTKRLYTKDEVYSCVRDCFNPEIVLELRSCVARSKDLVFTGDSHLGLASGMEFYKYEYPEGVVYVAHENWVTMYYLIRKKEVVA